MKRLPNVLDAKDLLRYPVRNGSVGVTLGSQSPRYADQRTKEAKALKAKRRELEAACGGKPSAVQATLIDRICEQHADLLTYHRNKATSEEPVSEEQDKIAVALTNTHLRALEQFRETLPPPPPPADRPFRGEGFVQVYIADNSRDTTTARMMQIHPDVANVIHAIALELQAHRAAHGLDTDTTLIELLARDIESGGYSKTPIPDVIVMKDQKKGGELLHRLRERLEAMARRIRVNESDDAADRETRESVLAEVQARAEAASEPPMRVEPASAPRTRRRTASANPDAPQSQEKASAPQLPPNITVDEIRQPTGIVSEGATLWTGYR